MTEITELPKNYAALARDRISEELKNFHGGQKEKAVSDEVATMLTHFCEENATFAELIYKTKRTISDCCTAILKGCGDYISDIDVYRGAVRYYFPNADIEFFMEVRINGDAPSLEEMNRVPEKPKPAPKAAPKPREVIWMNYEPFGQMNFFEE